MFLAVNMQRSLQGDCSATLKESPVRLKRKNIKLNNELFTSYRASSKHSIPQ